MVLRESTDMNGTGEDDELDDRGGHSLNYVIKMLHSSNKIDKRLIGLFKLR